MSKIDYQTRVLLEQHICHGIRVIYFLVRSFIMAKPSRLHNWRWRRLYSFGPRGRWRLIVFEKKLDGVCDIRIAHVKIVARHVISGSCQIDELSY